MHRTGGIWLVMALPLSSFDVPPAPFPPSRVAEDVHVEILSTNLADDGLGEWGFAALVRADGRCILFDTGQFAETVVENARRLEVDLGCVQDIVLSHFHGDHIGGAAAAVREILQRSPDSEVRVHVADQFFARRRSARGEYTVHFEMREALRALGAQVIAHDEPAEIAPGVWITGPITRKHDERNWGRGVELLENDEWIEDYVPDDQALTIMTSKGHVVLLGCGHAGTINSLEAVQGVVADEPIHAVIGGLHLWGADDRTLAWTAEQLRRIGVANLMGGHCTGIESVYRIRALAGLTRATAVVASVGSSFSIDTGINPRRVAR